jgi:hypothetical protein
MIKIIKFVVIGTIFILFCGLWLNKVETNKQDNIKTAIKKYNGVTQEHSNSMFPTVANPANELTAVFGNDSVRVMQPKAMNKKIKLEKYQYHEMLDRLSVITNIIDTHLQQHPVAKLDTVIKDHISKAVDQLYIAAQKISDK